MDMDDLTPVGSRALRQPVTPPAREPVATFTTPPDLSLDEIWHGRPTTRLTDATRGGSHGDPFGSYRPGIRSRTSRWTSPSAARSRPRGTPRTSRRPWRTSGPACGAGCRTQTRRVGQHHITRRSACCRSS
jgi:hypothetical protein